MPGNNCSIYGCSNSRGRNPEKSFFKVPGGKDDFDKNWAEKLISIITKARFIDGNLRKQIEKKNLRICSDHFNKDQMSIHDSRVTLIPGSLPTLNLPCVPHTTKQQEQRGSYDEICRKKSHVTTDVKKLPSYRSFADAVCRLNHCNLSDEWSKNIDSTQILLTKTNAKYIIPEYEVNINSLLEYSIKVFCYSLPHNHTLYTDYNQSCNNVSVPVLLNSIITFHLCLGVKSFGSNVTPHVIQKVYDVSNRSPIQQLIYFRSKDCNVLIPDMQGRCHSCMLHERLIGYQECQKSLKNATPVSVDAPLSSTSSIRLKATVQHLRAENKNMRIELENVKKELSTSSISVDSNLHKDLCSIFTNNLEHVPPFMKLFWQEQQSYIQSSKHGLRYHPQVIRYCLNLAAKSPAVYDELRYDDKKGTGCIVLPSRRRLRDFRNYITPQRGFNPKIIKELVNKTQSFTDVETFFILSFDEMKIQDNLVWDKHSGDLIGYVDLGDEMVNYAALKNVDTIASHILVFFLRSVVNPIKFPLANFATHSATGLQIFPLFWKAVQILEKKCKLKIIAATSDGASSNRRFYQMHQYFSSNKNIDPAVDVVYKVENPFAYPENRYIYFLSDPPHLLKTLRNCLLKSGASHSNKLMWNNNLYLLWSHIAKFFYQDQELSLHLLPKLSIEHISLTSYSKMNVKLAVQVLSSTVSKVLLEYGSPEVSETARFCGLVDHYFDIMNIRNCSEHTIKRNPFLKPFSSVDDERFAWLKDFLTYFSDWKKSIANRAGPFNDTDRANMFISHQTFDGIRITTNSMIECIQYLLCNGVEYVLTEKFNQDPLENYFGHQRAIHRRKDNPSIRDFGYGDNAIRNLKSSMSIVGGNVSSTGLGNINVIDTTPVPCRKRLRK